MSKQIAVNTAAAYLRTVFSAGLALFSSRWVLSSLGVTDFGLLSVVGSIIVFVTFLNSVLAGSVSRYFAYSIGQGNLAEVNRWFNAALSIHLCMAFLLILIGYPVGEYFIGHVLTIPNERVTACIWVFRISLVSAFVSMLSVPFVAMFTAKQHISELAAWGILQSTLAFTLAWLLRYASGDRLLYYANGMVAILVFVQLAQIFRAMIVFDECGIVSRLWFDRKKLKGIVSFATWNLIGSSGALFRDQGSAILLNIFFGPSVNAAYGIASQVSNQTNQLSTSMIGAFSPEITACEGRGDRTRMLLLAERASKFGTILVLLLSIPLIIEMDYVLTLWLRVPPPHTVLFCRLILSTFIIDRLSTGYMLAVNAHGKIAAYQATLGTTMLLTLPLAWFFLKIGLAPTSIGIAFITTITITSIGRVLWGRYLFGTPVRRWLISVVWPTIILAIIASSAVLAPCILMPASMFRFLVVTALSALASLLTAWFLTLDRNERELVVQNWRRLWSNLGICRQPEKY